MRPKVHSPLKPSTEHHQILTRCRCCLKCTTGVVPLKPDIQDEYGNVTYDDRQTFIDNMSDTFFPVNALKCFWCRAITYQDLCQILPATKEEADEG